jgi:hypothetical protein
MPPPAFSSPQAADRQFVSGIDTHQDASSEVFYLEPMSAA